jgi:ABC-type spermidine/putrescine transport system permease subunit II
MAKVFEFKKMRRTIMIYGVVQLFLIGLLIYMAVHFQAGLQAEGRPQRFLHSVVATLVIQLALFYPINRFATKEADREIEASAEGLGIEELKALRSKRMVGDVIKAAIFLFFVTFIYKAPKDLFILSVIFFSFILTFLSYFQCYNFSAKRLMKEKI